MKIENLKQLQKVMQLCRKQGVETIEIDGVKFQFGPQMEIPQRKTKAIANEAFQPITPGGITDETKIPTMDGITEEALLMWSVQNMGDGQ
jgi:hypothetical protein